jgi:uncharacterized protein (DUF2267 family)
MSATGLEVFDRTLQATNVWLDDIMRELNWSDRHKAYHALRTVLHALRDRLPADDSAHFAAQLPMLVRGMYFEGWRPAVVPVRERRRDEFLAHITDAFVFDVEADSAQILAGVLRVVERHLSPGAVSKVKSVLPEPIRQLWPCAVPVA